MALNHEEKEQVRRLVNEVSERREAQQPRPVAPTQPQAPTWTKVGVVLTGTALLISIVIAAIKWGSWSTNIEGQTKGLTERAEKLDMRIDEIAADIKNLPFLIKALTASADPTRPANQAAVRQLLADAKSNSITLPPEIVQESAVKFIDAAISNPGAWRTALAFFNYHSLKTTFNVAFKAIQVEGEIKTDWNIGPLMPGKEPQVGVPERLIVGVSTADAAKYQNIGQNLTGRVGVPMLMVVGGAVNLDGKDIRNVVFQKVEIRYSGKPLIMDNVLFTGCTFVMDNTAPSRRFGNTLIAASDRINFRQVG